MIKKIMFILIVLILICGVSEANIIDNKHYMIVVIVWDNETGEPEMGVPVTFNDQHTLYTDINGSVLYDTANLNNIENGSSVTVDCKYGVKSAPILYFYDGIQNWGTAITYNEPDDFDIIKTFMGMGLIATMIGSGIYLLRKKRNKEENNMINVKEFKLKEDFGVRALISVIVTLGFIVTISIAAYQNNIDLLLKSANIFTPIVMSVIMFYFGGSIIRDSKK